MSSLIITTFQPQITWPYGGSTATLRIKYSANFTSSTGQAVLRGLFQNVPCTIAAGVLTVPQFSLITTNDAQINPLVTCSAQFIDSNGAARDWLFQQFSIPQSLTPSCPIAALFDYNQGAALVLPPDFYLNRDETAALITAMIAAVGLGPATQLALGIVKLSAAAADPANPVVWEQGDPNARDAQRWRGVDLDATMADPADTNVPVFNAVIGRWQPGVGVQGAAGGDLSGTYPNPSVVDDSHGHSPLTLVGLGALALLSTIATALIDNDAVTFAKMQNIATDRLLGRDTASSGDVEEIGVAGGLEFSGSGSVQIADTAVTPGDYTSADITVDAKGRITAAANGSGGGGGSTDVLEVQVFS